MSFNIDDLLEKKPTPPAEEADEEEEAEEEPNPQPKAEEPAKPKVDHSIPVRTRVQAEMEKLSFEEKFFNHFERHAAKVLGALLMWEFDHYPEREGEWDYNEWTLVDFLKAFGEEARKLSFNNGGMAVFGGDTEDPEDPTMKILRKIIETKNEPPKPVKHDKPASIATKAESKSKPKKQAPKKDVEQLRLFDVSGII